MQSLVGNMIERLGDCVYSVKAVAEGERGKNRCHKLCNRMIASLVNIEIYNASGTSQKRINRQLDQLLHNLITFLSKQNN